MPAPCRQRRREPSLRGSLKVSLYGNGGAAVGKLARLCSLATELVVLAGEWLWRTSVAGLLRPVRNLVAICLALHSSRFCALGAEGGERERCHSCETR